MAFFNATQAELSKGRGVLLGLLFFFDFQGSPSYYWDGFGPLVFDGQTWLGVGHVGSAGDVSFGFNDQADSETYSMSGVSPEVVALARNSVPVRGRKVSRWGLFFGSDLQPLDAKFLLRRSVMDTITYSATGPASRRVSLTAESRWVNRNGAANAFFSDRDQQERFPGDLGFDRMSSLTGDKRVEWPVFN